MTVTLNRLFFALWPDDAVRAACSEAVRELRVRSPDAGRWMAAERYHLTLFFLGSTVSPAQEALARTAASQVRVAPFTLTLDHAGSFRKRRPAWWLGARSPPPQLAALVGQLHDGLLAARILPDRERFVPHVTVLREGPRPLPDTPVDPIAWPVREFVLVRSHLDRQPGMYEPVARWPLGAKALPQLDLWEN